MYSNIAGASMGTSSKVTPGFCVFIFFLQMVGDPGRGWGGVGLGACGVLEEQ